MRHTRECAAVALLIGLAIAPLAHAQTETMAFTDTVQGGGAWNLRFVATEVTQLRIEIVTEDRGTNSRVAGGIALLDAAGDAKWTSVSSMFFAADGRESGPFLTEDGIAPWHPGLGRAKSVYCPLPDERCWYRFTLWVNPGEYRFVAWLAGGATTSITASAESTTIEAVSGRAYAVGHDEFDDADLAYDVDQTLAFHSEAGGDVRQNAVWRTQIQERLYGLFVEYDYKAIEATAGVGVTIEREGFIADYADCYDVVGFDCWNAQISWTSETASGYARPEYWFDGDAPQEYTFRIDLKADAYTTAWLGESEYAGWHTYYPGQDFGLPYPPEIVEGRLPSSQTILAIADVGPIEGGA